MMEDAGRIVLIGLLLDSPVSDRGLCSYNTHKRNPDFGIYVRAFEMIDHVRPAE